MPIPFFSSLPSAVTTVAEPDPRPAHPSAKLPIELWREIFVHATKVAGGYDTSFNSPFEFSDITDGHNAFLKRLSTNHRTKQILCLVSRQWRAIAQELIFEYLFLQDTYDWTKLADGLEDSIRHDVERGGHGAGWYVRRLEISTLCWTKALGSAAARVVRCCPNLRVLTVGAFEESDGVPAELVAAVFETCPRALRSLDWTCDLGLAQTVQMFRLLPRVSSLQSFFMCVQHDLDAILKELKTLERVELPYLHTLELVSPDTDPSDVLTVMESWRLPSIRQVVLCGQAELEHASAFFATHGPQLHTLEFDYAGEQETSIGPEGPTRGAAMLLARCPNIKELVLQVHWAASQATRGHAAIERVGLRGLHLLAHAQARARGGALALPEHDAEQRTVLHALGAAFPMLLDRTRYPNVKLVRLLDFDQSRFRSVPWRSSGVAFWAFWVKRFERVGVRLEDHSGDLVRVVFREVNVLLPEDMPGGVPPRRQVQLHL
ncbi:hypothetical protein DFH11DRAFT_974052 [Phellopilus nigrolimitatus]|nr:hypothetical protein DFH11DRAFT_974052 [Phellopilus nigrolimitatus]